MSATKYTETHFDWIRNNFDLYSSSSAMAEAFERYFGTSMTDTRMRSLWKRLDLRRGNQHRYTREEDLWLSENANKIPYSKLSSVFNSKFNANVTKNALQQHCALHLGIYSDNPTQFGNRVAWNKLPMGSETVDKRSGTILIKTETGWINKARYIYGRTHGKIPQDHQVIFLDGNRQNFDIGNLYCIPTKYMILMNRNNWCTEHPEVTLAAIKYCELHYELQET